MSAPISNTYTGPRLRQPALNMQRGSRALLGALALITFAKLTGCVFAVEAGNGQRDAAADIAPDRVDAADARPDADVVRPDVVNPDTPDTGMLPDTGIMPDTGMMPDTGILPDTGMLPDSMPPVDARDSSADVEVGDTGPTCTPVTITETNFTTGDLTNVDWTTYPGSIRLPEGWTSKWDARGGLRPDLSTPMWIWDAPMGGTTVIETDPVTGEPALHMNSTVIDNVLRYIRTPIAGLSNATGSVFQIRGRVVRATGLSGWGCTVEYNDDLRRIRFGMAADQLLETYTGRNFSMDTTGTSNVYRVQLRSSNFSVLANGVFAFDQGGGMISYSSASRIAFGDMAATPGLNCDWYINHFAYYNGGTAVPFMGPRTYESVVYDLRTIVNNLGSGATIANTGTAGMSTSITLETRSGNTAMPDGTWSAWQALMGTAIRSSAARYLQVRITLGTTDPLATPRVDDYTVRVCTY